jgi:hypothetical protein
VHEDSSGKERYMTPSIPIATDNIYKFLALFGLVMFISDLWALAYFVGKYNEIGYENYLELEVLKAKGTLSSEEKVKRFVLEEVAKIIKRDWRILGSLLIACAIIGFFLSALGYYSWFKKVQPKQDELLNLQIEKMKYEIQVLNKELEKSA